MAFYVLVPPRSLLVVAESHLSTIQDHLSSGASLIHWILSDSVTHCRLSFLQSTIAQYIKTSSTEPTVLLRAAAMEGQTEDMIQIRIPIAALVQVLL